MGRLYNSFEKLKIILKTRLLEFLGLIVAVLIMISILLCLHSHYDYIVGETYLLFCSGLAIGIDFIIFRCCIKKYQLFSDEYRRRDHYGYYVLKIQYYFEIILFPILIILGVVWLFLKGIGGYY